MTGRSVSAVTAYTAHREWASRPPDERYASVHALYEAARARRQRSKSAPSRPASSGPRRWTTISRFARSSGRTATLTHWSFGQLATIAGAPPNYLRSLPASIASSAINYGLRGSSATQHQLFVEPTPHRGPCTRLRHRDTHASITTSWPAGCSTSWPSIRPGTYRSDTRTASSAPRRFLPAPTWETETCFCSSWTATAISTIPRTAPTPVCSADSFSGTVMSVPPPSRSMCSCFGWCAGITSSGDFSTWPASGAGTWVRRFRMRGRRRLNDVRAALDADTADDRTLLLRATAQELGPTRDAVLETAVQRLDLSQKQAAEAYTLAEQHETNPRSVWGYVQGLTRLSQRTPWQDGRFTLDRAARSPPHHGPLTLVRSHAGTSPRGASSPTP